MPFLDAALAFALTMLIVATIVTQIVQLLQHFGEHRSKQFAKMLKDFYAQELQPVVKREMERLSKTLDETVIEGIEKAAKSLEIEDLIPQGEQLAKLTRLSTSELKEALMRSKLGADLLKNLGDEAQSVFDQLSERYDAVGERFTYAFRSHSRRWATFTALVLALAVNVDSVFIAKSYISNEHLSRAVIAQSQAITQGYEKLDSQADDGQTDDQARAGGSLVQDAGLMIRESRQNIDRLQSNAFPIGWNHFPYSLYFNPDDPNNEERNALLGWLSWLVGVLLTGFFAGLGAPFWYDAVTGIARAVQRQPE